MNKVSRPFLEKTKVSFTVTVPGISKEDIPEIGPDNIVHVGACTDCSRYAYKYESHPKKTSAQRFSDVDSTFQYLMFILYKAADYHVKEVLIYYDDEENTMSFKMDFGTEFEREAERFFGYLFLNCGH